MTTTHIREAKLTTYCGAPTSALDWSDATTALDPRRINNTRTTTCTTCLTRAHAIQQRKAWHTALDTLGEAREAQDNGHEPENLNQLIDTEINAYIAYRTAERAYQTHLAH